MEELWKNVPIKEYKNYYQVSNLGRVRSVKRVIVDKDYQNRTRTYPSRIVAIHTPSKHSKYPLVCMCVNGYKRSFTVHKLVANAFIPNPENKPEINHKNGIKTDNCVKNLEWMTASENVRHAYKYLNRQSPMKGKLGKLSPNNKKINQYSKDDTFIKSYYSIRHAGKITGIDETNICKVLKNVIQTAGGFKWKYDERIPREDIVEAADCVFEISIKNKISKVKVL